MTPTRIGVFGWGLVAPGARDIDAFASMMLGQDSQLSRFDGFGPSNFLVGNPSFDFAAWRPWIDARFPPNRYPLLERKFGDPAKFAIASFIQALVIMFVAAPLLVRSIYRMPPRPLDEGSPI